MEKLEGNFRGSLGGSFEDTFGGGHLALSVLFNLWLLGNFAYALVIGWTCSSLFNFCYVGFYASSKKLTTNFTQSIAVGTNDQNRAKNQSDTVIPFDRNRVILTPDNQRQDSTYINASFIEGYHNDESFIITQVFIYNPHLNTNRSSIVNTCESRFNSNLSFLNRIMLDLRKKFLVSLKIWEQKKQLCGWIYKLRYFLNRNSTVLTLNRIYMNRSSTS